ncbi:MAG: phosphate acyltransferase PlsX [Clostridia bacterium]|jgi:glycerol-3-phosphate acyltransferase PlsX|nr:phosphate acyltransferase PlsX [Clostridia bacterium]MDH7573895.1 phosphate acyltransferase PlsX [Clostridia bacterium]
MRIAVDAMGGDYAPGEVVRGALSAARNGSAEVILVGHREAIEEEMRKWKDHARNITIVHAPEVITMDDPPATALRRKKGSSIWVATELVKTGQAQALVSAGSTGAQMAAALLTLGRIEGILRPAIATVFPTVAGGKLLLDVGANVDCRPQHLLQFAQMGAVYAERILGLSRPRVGLLNIGTERNKGNELTLAAYDLLAGSGLNFMGNVEPRDIPMGVADVVVCDGFVGNSLLKFGEGMAAALMTMLRQELAHRPLARAGAALVFPALHSLWKKLDYAEYGGAPLLGVRGVSVVCHGSSRARAIENAIGVAKQCVTNRLVPELIRALTPASEGGPHCSPPES